MLKLVLAAAAALAPAVAMASSDAAVLDRPDPYGANDIARNDYARTQSKLEAAVRHGAHSPEVLLNLAAIYAKQGRKADTQTLLTGVLAQPNVDMTTLTGTAWSHDLARKGMQITARPANTLAIK